MIGSRGSGSYVKEICYTWKKTEQSYYQMMRRMKEMEVRDGLSRIGEGSGTSHRRRDKRDC